MPESHEPFTGQERFVVVLFWFFWMLFGVIIVADLTLAVLY